MMVMPNCNIERIINFWKSSTSWHTILVSIKYQMPKKFINTKLIYSNFTFNIQQHYSNFELASIWLMLYCLCFYWKSEKDAYVFNIRDVKMLKFCICPIWVQKVFFMNVWDLNSKFEVPSFHMASHQHSTSKKPMDCNMTQGDLCVAM